jgi:RHS repeat-associated protein
MRMRGQHLRIGPACRTMLLLGALALMMGTASAQAQETVIYYHTDAIGSVRMITDQAGQVVARYDYLPFGEPWPEPPATADVRQFAGKERDPETKFNYFGARYYASGTGRFTSVDPVIDLEQALLDPQRWNRYAYALNRPLTFTDPDGKIPILAVAAILWGIYDVGSSIYDAYATYQTVRDPNASTREKLGTGGLFVAGMLPGVPGGGATVARTAIRHVDDVADVGRFTERNFRQNVARVLGDAPSAAAEAHHVFPQAGEFARNFERAGINVHDPRLGAWWTKPNHQQKAREYNDRWRQFFATSRNPTRDQILDFGRQLAKDYDLDVAF